jgi:predicted amidophosphoribosyltransferase
MTTTLPEVGNLDLLDDEIEHGVCLHCYPNLKPLDVFVATCGKEVVDRDGIVLDYLPPNACQDCVKAWERNGYKCPKCGRR